MRLVLNLPMTSYQLQQPARCRPLRPQTGDPIDYFNPLFSRFLGDDVTTQLKHLRHPWPIAVAHQGLTRREIARLDAPMAHIHRAHAFLAVAGWREGKNQRNVGLELRLILFHDHDIVTTLVYNRLRHLSLSQ